MPHSVQKSWVQIENVCSSLFRGLPVLQWASYRKNNNHLDPCPRIFHGYYFVYSWSAHQIPSFIHRAPCEDVPQSWPIGSFSETRHLPLLIENVLGLTLSLVSLILETLHCVDTFVAEIFHDIAKIDRLG